MASCLDVDKVVLGAGELLVGDPLAVGPTAVDVDRLADSGAEVAGAVVAEDPGFAVGEGGRD